MDNEIEINVRKEIKMNRGKLIAEFARRKKISKRLAGDVLATFIDSIIESVQNGEKVTLVGFGTWEARKRAARTGRNPQTGKEIKIAAKTVPAFSAGKKFKELVNKK